MMIMPRIATPGGEDGDESDSSSEELVSSTPAVDEEGGAEEHAADLDEQTDPDEGPEVLDAVEGDKEDASLFLDPDDDDGEVFEVVDGQPEIVKEGEGGSDEESVDTSGHVAELEEKLTAQEERLNHVEEQMGELEKERDDLKQRLIRNAADMENFRKRKERERDELRKYGADKLIMDLLPAIDNLERALEHAERAGEESSIADGVRMTHRQLVASLDKHGVRGFDSVGQPFDPQRHEAIQQVETTEHDTGTVVQEFQKGYFLHDRLLRPAMAVVAKRVDPPEGAARPSPTRRPSIREAPEADRPEADRPQGPPRRPRRMRRPRTSPRPRTRRAPRPSTRAPRRSPRRNPPE